MNELREEILSFIDEELDVGEMYNREYWDGYNNALRVIRDLIIERGDR